MSEETPEKQEDGSDGKSGDQEKKDRVYRLTDIDAPEVSC